MSSADTISFETSYTSPFDESDIETIYKMRDAYFSAVNKYKIFQFINDPKKEHTLKPLLLESLFRHIIIELYSILFDLKTDNLEKDNNNHTERTVPSVIIKKYLKFLEQNKNKKVWFKSFKLITTMTWSYEIDGINLLFQPYRLLYYQSRNKNSFLIYNIEIAVPCRKIITDHPIWNTDSELVFDSVAYLRKQTVIETYSPPVEKIDNTEHEMSFFDEAKFKIEEIQKKLKNYRNKILAHKDIKPNDFYVTSDDLYDIVSTSEKIIFDLLKIIDPTTAWIKTSIDKDTTYEYDIKSLFATLSGYELNFTRTIRWM